MPNATTTEGCTLLNQGSATREADARRNPCTKKIKSNPHLLQLKKSPRSNKDSELPKINK